MKRDIVIALGLLLAVPQVRAQAGNEDFRIASWRGGIVQSDLRLALATGGAGATTIGGVWTGLGPTGPGALFTNPAFLGAAPASISMTGRPPVSTRTFGLGTDRLMSPGDVRERTDQFLDDLGYTGSDSPEYTQILGLSAGQSGQLGSLSVAVPLSKGVTLAAGIHRPLSLSAGLRIAGMEAILDAGRRNGAQTIDIDVLARGSASLGMQAEMEILSAGFGMRLPDASGGAWNLGATLSRHAARASIDWAVRPDLMIVLSGSQQYFFNDPTDPSLQSGETNALFWNASARYAGRSWGGRAGLHYTAPGGIIAIGGGARWVQPISMKDPSAYAESYLPLFVNLSGAVDPGEFEEDLLDVEALNLAKPNLTRRTSDSLGTQLTLRQPVAYTLGLDIGMGPHTLTANYVYYHGELSAEGIYGSSGAGAKRFRVGKDMRYGLRFGLDLRFPDRLKGAGWLLLPVRLAFLDLDGLLFQALGRATRYRDPHYRIGGGLAAGDAVVAGVERNVRSDFEAALGRMLPTQLVLARRYTLFDQLDVGVTVMGVPDLLMRTSLNYRLP